MRITNKIFYIKRNKEMLHYLQSRMANHGKGRLACEEAVEHFKDRTGFNKSYELFAKLLYDKNYPFSPHFKYDENGDRIPEENNVPPILFGHEKENNDHAKIA